MTAPFALSAGRLHLRPIMQSNYRALCAIPQDPEVMYAYEHAFSDAEVQDWLDRQRMRYEKDGFGLWAAVRPDTGEMIGQCGLSMQPTPLGDVMEVGYLFRRDCWHQGYATQCARPACTTDTGRWMPTPSIPSSGTTMPLPGRWRSATACRQWGSLPNITTVWICRT